MDIRDVRFDTISTSPNVRATHLPTGKSVYVDASSSLHRNRETAIEALSQLVKRSAALDELGKLDGELLKGKE